MRRRIGTMGLMMGLVLAMGGCGGSAKGAGAGAPLRVLPAGDSITYGAGGNYYGYRGFLADLCAAAELELVLVGAERENLGVGEGHEGHPGWRSDELEAAMPGWLERHRPDVILLHIGTNDIFQGRPVTDAASHVDAILERIAQTRPEATTIVATPGPFRSPKNAQAQQLAAALAALVEQKRAAGRKVLLADLHAALASAPAGLPALLTDSAHPSDLGYYLMARAWFDALRRVAG